ncbi:MAG: efflux RND transporter periplasmic adaptor subunit [Pseudomonadota bacterium]
MRLQIRQSYVAAAVIFVIIAGYFLRGSIFGGGSPAAQAEAPPAKLFIVRAIASSAEAWSEQLVLRGQTQAVKKVHVRAEVAGTIRETPAAEGSAVLEGDVLCRLSVDAREADLQQAQATLEQMELEYKAAVTLNQRGNRSDTAVLSAKAQRDLATAGVERARIALSNTEIKAPFDGVFDTRPVEIGDYMSVGDVCGAVVQQQPFLVVGQVSERNVSKIGLGDPATARLATGEMLSGEVTFVSKIADEATRTFRVEVTTPNEELTLRDGVTAEMTLQLDPRPAHKISPAFLTLNDLGQVGLRILGEGDVVQFAPIQILSDTPDGAWISGLPQSARIITVGQEFVEEGQKVLVSDGSELEQGAS